MWLLNSLKKVFRTRDEMTGDGDIVKPFLDHLEDLRWTLIKMISTLAGTMLLAFGFRKTLAAVLAHPLRAALGDSEGTLISINPIESVTMSFTLSFYAGIVVSFPILIYFLAEFVLPALTRKEKRYVLPAVVVGFGLFLIGVVLCFLYVLPPTLKWLHSDAAGFGVKPSWTMKEYYGFVTHLCIAVGLVCELPVVMVTLSFIGLISYAWLKGMRIYGYALALVLAGVISPTPDLFMLFIFALPIMVLFEGCIWIVYFLEKRRAKHEAVEAAKYEQAYNHAHDHDYHHTEHHYHGPHDSGQHGPDPLGTDPHGSDLHGTDPHGSDPHGTDPHGTDPHGSDPHGTDPHGTDPHGTDPHGTDPHGTDPHGTDPHGSEHKDDAGPTGPKS
jgi:sec-independent protein translocase protein TatC